MNARLLFSLCAAAALDVPAAAHADDAMAEIVPKDSFSIPENATGLRRSVIQAALAEVGKIDGNASYGEVNIHRRELGKGAQKIIGFYSLDDLK